MNITTSNTSVIRIVEGRTWFSTSCPNIYDYLKNESEPENESEEEKVESEPENSVEIETNPEEEPVPVLLEHLNNNS